VTPLTSPTGAARVVPSRAEGRVGTTGRFPHLRALDGLRGFAVVLVVLSHFSPGVAPGGFLGVDLFFVLSGFLITSLLVGEVERSGRISLRNFWVRRARRLFPALLTVVAVVLAVTSVTGRPDEVHRVGADGLASVFYVANWHFVLSGQSYIRDFLDVTPSPLRHMWSLAIEEQFYILWPLVVGALTAAVGAGARRSLRRRLTALSLGLAALSLAWLVVLQRGGADLDRLYYGTDTRVFVILLGAALGAATAGMPTVAGRVPRALLVAAGSLGVVGLCVATVVVTTDSLWLYAGGFGAIAVGLVVVLAGAAQPGPNPLARVLEWRPLVGLGLISYGVYLWHWPITVWITPDSVGIDGAALFALRSALTLGLSLLSYRFIEAPVRAGRLPRLGPLEPAFTSVVVVAGLVVSLALPVIIYPAVREAPTGPPPNAATVATATAYEQAVRCDGPRPQDPIRRGERLLVQVDGNSIAGEMTPCFEEILASRGVDVQRVEPPGFLLCRDLPAITERVADPATRPDAAVVFIFTAFDPRCGSPWHLAVDDLFAMYERFGVHVFLVPSVPVVAGGREDLAPGPILEEQYYRTLAEMAPERFTFVDGGTFLRDEGGEYRWRMPCLTTGEAGCDRDGTVGVRFVDGLHFCTDPEFAARGCERSEDQAGQRRVAAAVAATVVAGLEERFG
jgi:peptidoglycan/LPS O-acetylase OafA/YrhL